MNFFDSLMAPLNRDHCLLFYILGLFSLASAAIALIAFVIGLFRKNSTYAMVALFGSFISNMIVYYFARIYYSICIAALR
jgi:ABC-type Fe3+-siderophore transport system permease subunit